MNVLSVDQQQELCQRLEELTAKCEGAPVPLSLENDIIIPPVNLLNLPRVKYVLNYCHLIINYIAKHNKSKRHKRC